MEITKDVITDLLPIYNSRECSADTKRLVEEFLGANPDFERQINASSRSHLDNLLARKLQKSDEMKSLKKAKRIMRIQGSIMALAIFFSLAPFSVFNVDGKTHWMMLENPLAACIYGAVGIGMWATYFIFRRRKRIL